MEEIDSLFGDCEELLEELGFYELCEGFVIDLFGDCEEIVGNAEPEAFSAHF